MSGTLGVTGNTTVSADLTVSGGCITLTGAATDVDLIDDNASALSFDASGKTGIIDIVTTNCSEGVTMSGTLGVTGAVTATGGIELSHACQNTLTGSGGVLSIQGNRIFHAGGTDIPVADGGTGASTLTANGILVGNGTSAIAATATMATKGHVMIGDGSGVPTMLAVGSNCQVLTACSGEATGVKWASAGGGAVSAINNATANELVTIGATTTELCAEANLTFDGTTLILQKDSGRPVLDVAGYANGPNSSGLLRLRHSNNTTPGQNTAMDTGEQLGEIRFDGSDNCAFGTGATIYALSNQAWTCSAHGTRLEFRTTADGATSNATRMIVTDAGDIDIKNNGLLNVGAADNDWTTNAFTLKGGTSAQVITAESTGSTTEARLDLIVAACNGGGIYVKYKEGAGNGSAAGTMGYDLGYDASNNYFKLNSKNTDGSGADADVWRVYDGGAELRLNNNLGSNFDVYDDALVLERHFSDPYRVGETLVKESQNELIKMGVLVRDSDGWVGQSLDRWVALLAGGVYQTRSRVDSNHACHEARIKELESKLGGCSG
jgi:hypothetical protein